MMTQDVMIVPHLARESAGTQQALTLGAGWHFYASGCQALSLSPCLSSCSPGHFAHCRQQQLHALTTGDASIGGASA